MGHKSLRPRIKGCRLWRRENPFLLRTNSILILAVRKVPLNPFDNALAVDQMEVAYSSLLARTPGTIKKDVSAHFGRTAAKDGSIRPKIVT